MINESVETLNQRLIDYFGQDTISGRAIWRVVWSTDETELINTHYTKEGLELLHPITREVKKYSYAQDRYILERLVLVPVPNRSEMTVKVSYEPMWVFEDKQGFPLPPKWEPIQHIVHTVYLALGKEPSKRAQYKDPDNGLTTEDLIEKEKARVDQLQRDLFGNETDVTDALGMKEGIVVPTNFEKRN